ncbi:hypothetical protein VM1G_10611 [Cytospora mali]|uniref:Spo12-like protein n=1 Tax=Cytospora mali TaxID=578113 RepID=A0A194VIX4_CYTMA|nr:hypothetical protein VM1G_10611 [Valsa mali]
MTSTTGNANATKVLAAKDTNVPMTTTNTNITGKDAVKGDMKSMDYQRQLLQSKMETQKYEAAAAPAPHNDHHKAVSKLTQEDRSGNNYISPSDEIMSPCTAKLNALRNKQVGKVKPKSLFAQTSTKRLRSNEGLFGNKAGTPPSTV